MKGLIWQDDENIIDVVYQTIYGLPIKEAIHVVKLYQEKQLIPVDWIKSWAMKNWVKSKKCEFDIIVSKLIDDWLEEENADNQTD